MLKFQTEQVSDCLMEIQPLIVAHYKEIATHTSVKKLDPDYTRYVEMENAGILHIYTVRDEGKLVGYFISMVMPHLHYKTCTVALNDILYIAPEYRGGTTAYRMFKGALKDLKDNRHVQLVMFHMKIKHPFSRLLTKLGAKQTEETWEVIL